MRLSGRVIAISDLKSRTAALVRELQERQEPLIITQNGEARAVMLDVATFDQWQETMALLKILAMGDRQASRGDLQLAEDAITGLRETG